MVTKYILMIKRKRPAGHNGWGDLHQEQAEVAKAGHLPVIINPMHCNVFLCLSDIVRGLLKRRNPFEYFILTLQISITCVGYIALVTCYLTSW